jgi:flavodoxin
MNKTAIVYSPEGGNVNSVTIKLGEVIGNDKVDIIPVKEVLKGDLNKFNQIIFVGSTVGADHWNNEEELTTERLEKWISILKLDFEF